MRYATYSPEDNKLRLYVSKADRLDDETYKRVKEAGFIWAPQQVLFVAPAWSPSRADLLTELCGEIGDEDTSLVERAEERAERFEDYSERRAEDAERAKSAVDQIADGIPFGQPILVGHHSERRARKDAEKIQNGMRKAVQMWQTSQYWESRAAGALRHAKYKESPAVRYRRIKGLESDIRVYRSKFTPDPKTRPQVWDGGEEQVWCRNGSRGGYWVKSASLPAIEAYYTRWIQHCKFRLAYERAMLGESGADPNRFNFQVGGKVLVAGEWVVILRISKDASGEVSSLTTSPLSSSRTFSGSPAKSAFFKVTSVKDYREPAPEDIQKAKQANKLPPMCNYPGEGFKHITKAQWDAKYKDYKGAKVIAATERAGEHRVRCEFGYKGNFVFLTDAKEVLPPTIEQAQPAEPVTFEPEPDFASLLSRPVYRAPERTEFDSMREALKAGTAVKVVSAPQLFATSRELAREAVATAGVMPGHRVLEPEAGTGVILDAIQNALTGADCGRVVAVEINRDLAAELERKRNLTVYANESNYTIRQADFLELTPEDLGLFDRIVMNPPFVNGADIEHIKHAMKFLKAGGRLVSICAAGPRQVRELKPLGEWRELPEGSFDHAGTGVHTAMVIIDAPPTVESDPRELLKAEPDPLYKPKLDGDRLTAEFRSPSTKRLVGKLPIEKSPLFGGDATLPEAQTSLF